MQVEISPVLATTLVEVIDAAIELTGAAFGNIQLFDADDKLRIVAYRGFPEWWIEYWNTVTPGHGVCGSSLATSKRVVVEDIETSPIFAGTPALAVQLKAGIRAVQSTPLHGRSGEVVGMLSTHFRTPYSPDAKTLKMLDLLAAHVVTLIENARAEQRVRDSEERYRSLFTSMDEGYCVIRVLFDDAGKPCDFAFEEVNPVFELHTGIQNAVGRSMREIAPSHEEYWFETYGRIALTGVPERFQNSARALNRWHDVYAFRIGNPEERRVAVLFNDITERKGTEVAMQELTASLECEVSERATAQEGLLASKKLAETANLSKSKFLAAASHDLRQPITVIDLYLELLSNSPLNADQSNIVARLKHSSATLSVMLNALLDVAKLDSGFIYAEYSPLRADELFNWIEEEFVEQFNKRGMRLDYFCQRNELVLHTDFALLRSILGNLLGNALKYCDKGRTLITLRRRGQRALLQVWDNGIGIAPEHLGHVFNEYFQVGNPERNLDKGLGLGLSIVARKAELIRGEIECRSQLGKGTVFSLWLPLATNVIEAPNGNRPSPKISIGQEHFAGKRFALIEDNADLREVLVQSFRTSGLELAVYDCAASALASPELMQADFYISDFRLPGNMNGMQLLDEIKRRRGSSIKGVLLTGDTLITQSPSSDSEKWKLLIKPCRMKELLEALAALE